ncbi:uncharacterized protein LOC133185376 [Saccostrea echinata]|uniref:uncharacterized protein LOC133185376 n=1 Tax=Saccostrea echinata TaxID=191078 RepID=UPI002A829199|nr:uncharacterized protein LOC133185376 [Saccostrea echinata]
MNHFLNLFTLFSSLHGPASPPGHSVPGVRHVNPVPMAPSFPLGIPFSDIENILDRGRGSLSIPHSIQSHFFEQPLPFHLFSNPQPPPVTPVPVTEIINILNRMRAGSDRSRLKPETSNIHPEHRNPHQNINSHQSSHSPSTHSERATSHLHRSVESPIIHRGQSNFHQDLKSSTIRKGQEHLQKAGIVHSQHHSGNPRQISKEHSLEIESMDNTEKQARTFFKNQIQPTADHGSRALIERFKDPIGFRALLEDFEIQPLIPEVIQSFRGNFINISRKIDTSDDLKAADTDEIDDITYLNNASVECDKPCSNYVHCPFGFLQGVCPRCECAPDPCTDNPCSLTEKCVRVPSEECTDKNITKCPQLNVCEALVECDKPCSNSVHCPFGFLQGTCPRCDCAPDPCANNPCNSTEQCFSVPNEDCPDKNRSTCPQFYVCKDIGCDCPVDWEPVCGTDADMFTRTYINNCTLNCHSGVIKVYDGECWPSSIPRFYFNPNNADDDYKQNKTLIADISDPDNVIFEIVNETDIIRPEALDTSEEIDDDNETTTLAELPTMKDSVITYTTAIPIVSSTEGYTTMSDDLKSDTQTNTTEKPNIDDLETTTKHNDIVTKPIIQNFETVLSLPSIHHLGLKHSKPLNTSKVKEINKYKGKVDFQENNIPRIPIQLLQHALFSRFMQNPEKMTLGKLIKDEDQLILEPNESLKAKTTLQSYSNSARKPQKPRKSSSHVRKSNEQYSNKEKSNPVIPNPFERLKKKYKMRPHSKLTGKPEKITEGSSYKENKASPMSKKTKTVSRPGEKLKKTAVDPVEDLMFESDDDFTGQDLPKLYDILNEYRFGK